MCHASQKAKIARWIYSLKRKDTFADISTINIYIYTCISDITTPNITNVNVNIDL